MASAVRRVLATSIIYTKVFRLVFRTFLDFGAVVELDS